MDYRRVLNILLILGVAGLSILAACRGNKSGNPDRQAAEGAPVTVARAVEKDVPVEIKVIGHVEPYATIEVKSRVGGELTGVYFEEGKSVRKGDRLLQIDPRPYQAALDGAKSTLEKDRALLKNAEDDAHRYADLVQKDYVTREQYDQILTNAEALRSTVRADEAAVQNAALNVEYCAIRSPIDGRTGALLVNRGNQIKANDTTGIVVINQVHPIYVSFAVPEQYLSRIRLGSTPRKLPVKALVPASETFSLGQLDFVDNTVDSQTGTINLKAVFPNEDDALWSGQFVDVSMFLTTLPQATVVPSQAVQASQEGTYVYVVRPDGTAEFRIVKTGISHEGDTVIEQGVSPGETVVTDGQLRLTPGIKVEVVKGR
jgi:multidrug efflux system membrane fusion protein